MSLDATQQRALQMFQLNISRSTVWQIHKQITHRAITKNVQPYTKPKTGIPAKKWAYCHKQQRA
jgi:hypothetical protein